LEAVQRDGFARCLRRAGDVAVEDGPERGFAFRRRLRRLARDDQGGVILAEVVEAAVVRGVADGEPDAEVADGTDGPLEARPGELDEQLVAPVDDLADAADG